MTWAATMPPPVKSASKRIIKQAVTVPDTKPVVQPELREEEDEQTAKKKRKPADRVHRTVGSMNKVTR